MQFVKLLSEQELSQGVELVLQERCGRVLEQIIPYQSKSEMSFVLILNDLTTIVGKCMACSKSLVNDAKIFHVFQERYYHKNCCPAPWHDVPKQIGICSSCKLAIYSNEGSCAHPSPIGQALLYHKTYDCCCPLPYAHSEDIKGA